MMASSHFFIIILVYSMPTYAHTQIYIKDLIIIIDVNREQAFQVSFFVFVLSLILTIIPSLFSLARTLCLGRHEFVRITRVFAVSFQLLRRESLQSVREETNRMFIFNFMIASLTLGHQQTECAERCFMSSKKRLDICGNE